jgi:integration host factor subunit beta
MTKSQLIEKLSTDAGLPLNKADEVVNLVFREMSDALAKGDRVEIRGFGTFKVKHYDGYTGRNPKTLEPVEIKPKKLPFFRCGRELKKKVND